MAHSAYTEYEDKLCAFSLESCDLFGICGKVILCCKVSLILGNCVFAEGIEECIFHSALECSLVGRRKGIAFAVCPLVHIERINVVALDLPFSEEVNSPLIHTHRTYGEDESDLFACFFSFFDLESDLVTHKCVESINVVALYGGEILVPEILTLCRCFGSKIHTLVDLVEIPSCRIEAFE